MTAINHKYILLAVFLSHIINTGDFTVKEIIETFDQVQKLPNVVKQYIAQQFIVPPGGIYVEEKKYCTQEEQMYYEPFEYSNFGEKIFPTKYLRYYGNNHYRKIKMKKHLTDDDIRISGPSQTGLFVINSTVIKSIKNKQLEYSLRKTEVKGRLITALHPKKDMALTFDELGDFYTHSFNNNQGFTEKLNLKLPLKNGYPIMAEQMLIPHDSACIIRTDGAIYIVPFDTHKSCHAIRVDDVFNKKETDDSSHAIFSHIDCLEQYPDHLLIEICYGTTLQKLTNDYNILRKCIMYHIPSSRHIDIATFYNNNRPTRLSHGSLSSCTRTLDSKVSAKDNKTYNILSMVSSKKTRALLQAYLILTAADLWNKQKEKSKEDAGVIIRKLKEIPYAGCIYTIKDFKKVFDEMRTYL